jgi:hypothetical protein
VISTATFFTLERVFPGRELVPSGATRREMAMRVNFVVAMLIATGFSVTTHWARSVP